MRDACDEAWPVCSEKAGCILGPESFAEGRFPGRTRFVVSLPEPSRVRVGLFLEDVTAAGEQTVVSFHEEGCRSRVREVASGRAVQGEMEQLGHFSREAELTGVGDHLVEVESDMQGRWVLRVEVEPLRNR